MATHDAIVIGTGQAGPSLAVRLAGAGMTVAIIERGAFGGTCVNTGCTPTKAMVASAYAAHLARRAAEYGVSLGGPVSVDLRQVKARKDAIVAASSGGVERWLRGTPGCTVVTGHARFVAPRAVQVGEERLEAERIFINVGGRPTAPPIPGLDGVPFLTSSSMMALETLPRHLVVIGGSYVGLEFAQMFRRFGAEVTVVEAGPRLVQREDAEISDTLRQILEAEGISVVTGAGSLRVAPRAEGFVLGHDQGGEIAGSHLLVATGRRPNTDDLDLDRAGVAVDARGYITVDDRLATNVPGIWALGDCNGRGAFTHTAYNDYEILAANLLDGAARSLADRVPAYALYTDPPLGRVGLTETEARAGGRRVLVGRRPMTRVARAVEKGESAGLMKIVVDAGSQAILGAAILGTGGDEAIHGIIDLMNARAPYPVLQRAMPIHPTVSELLPTLLGELQP